LKELHQIQTNTFTLMFTLSQTYDHSCHVTTLLWQELEQAPSDEGLW